MENILQNNTRQQKVVLSESMRELGAARFVLGGVFLFFGIFIIWIGLYIVGILTAIFALLLMEYCSEIIIDSETRRITKRAGWLKPFLTLKKRSFDGAVSMSIDTVSVRHRGFGQKISPTRITYKLNFELPGKKILINSFTEKTKATAFANAISKLLGIKLEKQPKK